MKNLIVTIAFFIAPFITRATDNERFMQAMGQTLMELGKGIDVFFRDSKMIKNGDLWANYSYCDSKRLFGNYLTEAQPTFVSNYNLNVV